MEASISSRIRNFAFRLAALLMALLVSGVVLEIGLRIFGPPYYRFNNLSQEYYSNPRGYHDVLRHEGRHTIYGLTYHEDEHGYRASSDRDEPPETTPRGYILGLGDSFTFGRGVRHEDIYLTRLGGVLKRDQRRVAVKNCGVVGAGVEEVLEIYERESETLPPGSIVLYGLVLNDFGLDTAGSITGLNFIDLNNGGYAFKPIRQRSALVNFIYHAIETRRLHTATVRAYLESFEGESAAHGFERLEDLHRSVAADGGTFVVVIFPLLYDLDDYRFISIHERIGSFCERNGIPCLDLLPAFARHRAEELWANPTDHHPNELAHRITADEVARFLEEEFPDLGR